MEATHRADAARVAAEALALAAQHTAAAQHQQAYAAVTAAQQAQAAADEQYRVAYYQLYGAWQAYAVADGSRGQYEEDSGCCVIG